MISKVGLTHSFEIQNNLRLRAREEGFKKAHLWDTTRGSSGHYLECVVGQNPSPTQGASMGQSPRSFREQIRRPTMKSSQAVQRAKCKGMLVEKIKGTTNPSFALVQESGAIVDEERGFQEKIPTQTLGQSEDNNTMWGLSREERRILKETNGSQTEEKGSSFCASD